MHSPSPCTDHAFNDDTHSFLVAMAAVLTAFGPKRITSHSLSQNQELCSHMLAVTDPQIATITQSSVGMRPLLLTQPSSHTHETFCLSLGVGTHILWPQRRQDTEAELLLAFLHTCVQESMRPCNVILHFNTQSDIPMCKMMTLQDIPGSFQRFHLCTTCSWYTYFRQWFNDAWDAWS